MIGYSSAGRAVAAIQRMGMEGPFIRKGQQCGPVLLADGSWAYETRRSVAGGPPYSDYIFPGGEILRAETDEWRKFLKEDSERRIRRKEVDNDSLL